ncbi:MAG: glutamine-hydrolyzing carbamoyl-phosphate synthase small subunit [Phycisphaerales bacterium]
MAQHKTSAESSANGSESRPVARLGLENGFVFRGRGFGALTRDDGSPMTTVGEVVFNTAMCGYQESLTDPSYSGQILTMTAPEIGNYGVNLDDLESTKAQVAGFVIRELARRRSNFRATHDLSEWLAQEGVLGIEGIDTRALTRRLRIQGAMRGALTVDDSISDERLVELARTSPDMSGQNLVREVSPPERYGWSDNLGEWRPNQTGEPVATSESAPLFAPPVESAGTREGERPLRIVAIDCGAKRNILRHLADRGCEVIVLPHDATPDQIRAENPDGLFISNGPGDPAAVENTISSLRELAGETPTFGICLGHQLLCLALGAKTYKLKFGHRGANQPVKNLLTGRVEITSQNHGFAVDVESIRVAGCEPTHINLNDETLAGFRSVNKPIFAVQYHPEASPGPHDASYLFDCFIEMIRKGAPLSEDEFQAIQRGGARRAEVGADA